MIALGKVRREGICAEALKLFIDIQRVQVPSGQSRSGQAGSECCHWLGDWPVSKRTQRGSRP